MTGLGIHPETGYPYELPGAEVPKPGRDVGTNLPENFVAPPAKPWHQSPPADEQVAKIAGAAMQALNPNMDF